VVVDLVGDYNNRFGEYPPTLAANLFERSLRKDPVERNHTGFLKGDTRTLNECK